jgi:LAS superfamily LD-carboxypeptidase LdcB
MLKIFYFSLVIAATTVAIKAMDQPASTVDEASTDIKPLDLIDLAQNTPTEQVDSLPQSDIAKEKIRKLQAAIRTRNAYNTARAQTADTTPIITAEDYERFRNEFVERNPDLTAIINLQPTLIFPAAK